jgi:hypothetical protein
MKKSLLALALLASTAASAQITLEKKYPIAVEPFKLANGALKFIGVVEAANQIRIYNADHSLLRQVTVPVAAGERVNYVEYGSDRLFNTNASLEFVVYLNTQSSNTTRVMDESGATLLTVDSCSYVTVHNTAVGAKMITYSESVTSGSYSKVYGLGGTYTPLKTAGAKSDAVGQPYPNPATESLRLPYELKVGQVATLTVSTATGQTVKTYQVDNTFDHLVLNARELRAGVYLYRLTLADGTVSAARRFVVQR